MANRGKREREEREKESGTRGFGWLSVFSLLHIPPDGGNKSGEPGKRV